METEKKKRRLSKPRIVIIVICCVVLACAIGYGIYYLIQMNRATNLAEDTVARYLTSVSDTDEELDPRDWIIDWDALWAVNPDVCGWLYIPAIPIINYPIIHYTDNDYYLRRAWTGEPLEAGCIMEDYHCSPDFKDLHTILYGHNMTVGSMAGTMFGQLKKFQDQTFFDENDQRVFVYTPEATLEYEIFSIHVVYPSDTSVYTVGEFDNEHAESFVEGLCNATEVNTGRTADGSDKILTLSTCSGNGATKRLVVHSSLDWAKDIATGEEITDTFGRTIIDEFEDEDIEEFNGFDDLNLDNDDKDSDDENDEFGTDTLTEIGKFINGNSE